VGGLAAEFEERILVNVEGHAYCPPDLAVAAAEGDGSVAPYSDRYGRDMLLIELLVMDCGLSPDDPPSRWSGEQLQRRYTAWQARADARCAPILPHLNPTELFTLGERDRPASAKLAADLELSLPTRRLLRHRTRAWNFAPVVLGHRLPSACIGQVTWRSPSKRLMPATLQFIVPWRWSRPEADPSYRTFWKDTKMALGCAAILLLPGIMALIVLVCKAIANLFGMRG